MVRRSTLALAGRLCKARDPIVLETPLLRTPGVDSAYTSAGAAPAAAAAADKPTGTIKIEDVRVGPGVAVRGTTWMRLVSPPWCSLVTDSLADTPPSPEPAEVFAASTSRSLRALAGPGTGKTYALIKRLTRLVDSGVDPTRIMVVTFARAAAQDLVSAAAEVEAAGGKIVPSTLHSYCFGLLARDKVLEATGRVPRILVGFERDLLLMDLEGEDFGAKKARRARLAAFEAAWSRRQSEAPGAPVDGLDQGFQTAVLDSLTWHRGMLVGEVIPQALAYLEHNPNAEEFDAYDHVLVDEYQDLNRAEQEVLNLISTNAHLAVIGDDDQSIYGFKQAYPEGIRNFHEDRPDTEDVQFVVCRRCPAVVVTMAQTLIGRNPGRVRAALQPHPGNPEGELHHVQWESVAEEAKGVAVFLDAKIAGGVDPGDCLVLTPRRKVGYAIRDEILAKGHPCATYFQEEAISEEQAMEALCLLTLLANPDDRLALRAWLAIGSSTEMRQPYRRLYTAARERNVSVGQLLGQLDKGDLAIPYTSRALARWRELNDALDRLRAAEPDLSSLVDRLFPDGVPDLEQLRHIACDALQDADSVAALASAVRAASSVRELPTESAEVRVMTMHGSKGLTAQVVVLAGLCHGLMPTIDYDASPAEQTLLLEEQRRLFFVGVTRTKEVMVFSSYSRLDTATAMSLGAARGRKLRGGFGALASPFLAELGPSLPRAVSGSSWRHRSD
jgi:DNA helicase-2/ATP-dependent DNA helicase PcrA